MGDIYIKVKKIRGEAADLKRCEKEFDNAIEGIDTIMKNISLGSATNDIKKQLGNAITELEKQKSNVNKLIDCLRTTAALYENAETNIINTDIAKSINNTDADSGKEIDVKEVWDDIKEFLLKIGLTPVEIAMILKELGELPVDALWEALTGGDVNWEEWFKKYIPENVSDSTVLALYGLLSKFGMSEETIDAHKENNEEAWKDYTKEHEGEKYIENQSEMSDMEYGNYTGDANTCGVIATYNALQSLTGGNAPALPELLAYYEDDGIAANGMIGTSPTAINDYFESNGYETKMLTGGRIDSDNINSMSSDYDTYVMLSYNNKSDVGSGLHYLSITHEEDGYVIHNGGESDPYPTLEDAIKGYNEGNGEPITVIGIR